MFINLNIHIYFSSFTKIGSNAPLSLCTRSPYLFWKVRLLSVWNESFIEIQLTKSPIQLNQGFSLLRRLMVLCNQSIFFSCFIIELVAILSQLNILISIIFSRDPMWLRLSKKTKVLFNVALNLLWEDPPYLDNRRSERYIILSAFHFEQSFWGQIVVTIWLLYVFCGLKLKWELRFAYLS